jgi:glutamate-1-semialdehyde 2,1-aminomutase
LQRLIPCAERVHFCNSGSEGVLHSLRLARGVTNRKRVLKFYGSYHGWGDAVRPGAPHEPDDVRQIAGALFDTARHTVNVHYNDLDGVNDVLDKIGDDVAAILVEPVAHNLGCIMPEPGFLEGLRAAATKSGALLIFDEVITGFRHAPGGYQALAGVTPDLAVFAKAMANGLPCAAVCGAARFMDRYSTADGDVLYAGTFNAHPAIMAAAQVVLARISEPNFHDALFATGERLRHGLDNIIGEAGYPCMVAGFGSTHIVYFREPGRLRDYSDLASLDRDRDRDYRRKMVARGHFVLPHAGMRSYVSAAHSHVQIDGFLTAAEDSLREVFSMSGRHLA